MVIACIYNHCLTNSLHCTNSKPFRTAVSVHGLGLPLYFLGKWLDPSLYVPGKKTARWWVGWEGPKVQLEGAHGATYKFSFELRYQSEKPRKSQMGEPYLLDGLNFFTKLWALTWDSISKLAWLFYYVHGPTPLESGNEQGQILIISQAQLMKRLNYLWKSIHFPENDCAHLLLLHPFACDQDAQHWWVGNEWMNDAVATCHWCGIHSRNPHLFIYLFI